MVYSLEMQSFIEQHLGDDVDRLLLSAHRYPGVDVPFAADQIAARKQLRLKLPEWYANMQLVMGGRVPAEQCSSEQTARYKRQLVKGDSLCDLTGGMGIDLYYMSRGLSKAIYTERQSHLCEAARHNFTVLGADNIEVREGDGRQLGVPDVDTLYLDPARRASDGSRVYDLAECEPDVVSWQDELLSHCRRLVVKISPMADLHRVLQLMPCVSELHVVGVKNECKEILLVAEPDTVHRDVEVHCVDFRSLDTIEYVYHLDEETIAEPCLAAEGVSAFLYEPDVTLLKAGCFKSLCRRFVGLRKLDVNTHLYTSEHLIEGFPGRSFRVDDCMEFSSKLMKSLKKQIPQANITARNFPLTADQIRKKAGIRDGGEVYLFAAALQAVGNVLVSCRKVMLLLLSVLLPIVGGVRGYARQKPAVELPTIEQLVADVNEPSPIHWPQGKLFVFRDDNLNVAFVPEEPLASIDTLHMKGQLWRFDSMVSEEDWMGQQILQVRFISETGRAYRFNTEKTMSVLDDSDYRPVIPSLYPISTIQSVDSILRARSLFILLNDDRVICMDSLSSEKMCEKYVEVTIDSVSYGTEEAPLRVYFSRDGFQAQLLTSLPDSREARLSTPLNRCFSVRDPYKDYPNIKPETWSLIRQSLFVRDMTLEEVRLSLGRPLKIEKLTTRLGLIERWYYPNSRVLEFLDGRLH